MGLSPAKPPADSMKKRCPNCRLVNFPDQPECVRCRFDLIEISADAKNSSIASTVFRRAIVCAAVCLVTLLGFYISMLFTSAPLKYEEKKQIKAAVKLLSEKGFDREAFLLGYLTSFRGNDNWLNASTKTENAYAATNFPFEVMTVYPDFFLYPADDTERAAVLLHEAQHLKGADEKEAYEYVWRNRRRLGWTRDRYINSVIWQNVRKQTREYAPHLFVCGWRSDGDCTEENQTGGS